MWEWRCFAVEDNYQYLFDKYPQFDEVPWEIRRDTYYEFEDDGFGLKERWTLIDSHFYPKLELKIRGDRTRKGIEYWDKCVEIPFNSEGIIHLKIEEIKRMINALSPSSEFARIGIAEFIPFLDNDFYIINVAKERKQIQVKVKKKSVILEYVRGKVEGYFYFGISIESERKKRVRRLGKELDLFKQEIIMGYPEYVALHKELGIWKII